MGSFDCVTYLECCDSQQLLKTFSSVFGDYGYLPVNAPSYEKSLSLLDENPFDEVLKPKELLVAVMQMNQSWVKINCHPCYLLCADVAGRMLIQPLCDLTGSSALVANIYDGCDIASVYVEPGTDPVCTGATYDAYDYLYETYPDVSSESLFGIGIDGKSSKSVEIPFHGGMRNFVSLEASFDKPEIFKGVNTDIFAEDLYDALDSGAFPEETKKCGIFYWREDELEKLDHLFRFRKFV
ncbi:hypothetical protein [Desulfatibacillum aliphaticivorans]|uniref:hypothetical protein n=1 Tax=Desulfatibacillum aliphaticivorans TaxID=218208 RepID=UPI0004084FEF|nr:hypothetical protein [Desulfatibacillum aliphaticivorans]